MSLAGRRILITGAARGLGAAVAVACAAAGAELILLGRTRGSLEAIDDQVQAAGGAPATLVPLDLMQGDLVDKLGQALFERHGRLDGLVACAAELGQLMPVSHMAPADLARVMTINALANHRLIRTLEPLLRASDAGRAVFLTDRVLDETTAYWGPYAASKRALDAIVIAWASEIRLTQIRAVLVEPGPMATRLRAKAFPGERPGQQPEPATRVPAILALLEPDSQRTAEIVRLD